MEDGGKKSFELVSDPLKRLSQDPVNMRGSTLHVPVPGLEASQVRGKKSQARATTVVFVQTQISRWSVST